MKRISFVLLFSAVTFLNSQQAEAQRRMPHYQRTPSISPYVNLFRSDNGGLNSFVISYKPTQRLRQFVNETNQAFYNQRLDLNQQTMQLSQDFDQTLQEGQTQQQPVFQMRPTSTTGANYRQAAGFMTHSRYFPQSSGAPAAGAGRSARQTLPRGGGGITGGGIGGGLGGSGFGLGGVNGFGNGL